MSDYQQELATRLKRVLDDIEQYASDENDGSLLEIIYALQTSHLLTDLLGLLETSDAG